MMSWRWGARVLPRPCCASGGALMYAARWPCKAASSGLHEASAYSVGDLQVAAMVPQSLMLYANDMSQ